MSRELYLHCNECGNSVDVHVDADAPIFCPLCRTVDNFSDIEIDATSQYVLVNGIWRLYDETNSIQ